MAESAEPIFPAGGLSAASEKSRQVELAKASEGAINKIRKILISMDIKADF